MAKLYSKKQPKASKMLPNKSTVNFLLDYSKALTMLKVGKFTFESIAN